MKVMTVTSYSTGKGCQHHFVLVHGACHGAWCWAKLKRLLEIAGQKVTAIDLAGSGESPVNADDLTSFDEYNQPLVDLFTHSISSDQKVILVGHSFGGLSVTAISEQFSEKISVVVYVAAMMLDNISFRESEYQDPSLWERIKMNFSFKNGPNMLPTSMIIQEDTLRSTFYQLSATEDQDYAVAHVRPAPAFLPFTKILHTANKYGKVPRVFIQAEDDETIGVDHVRAMVAGNLPNEVLSVEGDHMVMVSRASALQQKLDYIASKYQKRS